MLINIKGNIRTKPLSIIQIKDLSFETNRRQIINHLHARKHVRNENVNRLNRINDMEVFLWYTMK